MKSFTSFEVRTGLLFDYMKSPYPTKLWGFDLTAYGERDVDVYRHPVNHSTTLFIYFFAPGYLTLDDGTAYLMRSDTYCCVQNKYFGYIQGGYGFIVERFNYLGMFMVGGPVEQTGRLMYIDGCTDSLLIPPVKLGDPCFNALFFPSGIDQTSHTHPSIRIGMVIRGEGSCIYMGDAEHAGPSPNGQEAFKTPLTPGMLFVIHEEGLHKFQTVGTDGMVVVAWHPDSDFGPQDENHPMINRTIVQGVSANSIPEIQTKHINGTDIQKEVD
jgi:hypothetical protein